MDLQSRCYIILVLHVAIVKEASIVLAVGPVEDLNKIN
jgi:hypothetical protein